MTTLISTAGAANAVDLALPATTDPAQGCALMDAPVAERDAAGRFLHGRPKTGGRTLGVPNKDRRLSIDRIMATADPVGFLCRIVNGETMDGVTPTMLDRISAAKVMPAKVMPDLKQIGVDDGGTLVQVVLQLGQKVTVSQ